MLDCNLYDTSHIFPDFHQATAMDAFKGKFERTSADQYEEFLKVSLFKKKITDLVLFPGFGGKHVAP